MIDVDVFHCEEMDDPGLLRIRISGVAHTFQKAK